MTAPLRILLADDESIARRRLLQFLAQESDVRVVAECANGADACAAIVEHTPDLVFLDVEMPELSGLDVVRRIGADNMPATVFATAFDHYAVAAFDANAVDYLLKPFDGARFGRAMAKARAMIEQGRLSQSRTGLARMLEQVDDAGRLLVRSDGVQQMVRLADVLYVSAEGNYVRLHASGAEFQMRERMIGMLERLEGTRFRRVHRSHIVNLDHIRKILPWFAGERLLILSDGTRLTLSRTYRSVLDELEC